jgi:hypothetical protein
LIVLARLRMGITMQIVPICMVIPIAPCAICLNGLWSTIP